MVEHEDDVGAGICEFRGDGELVGANADVESETSAGETANIFAEDSGPRNIIRDHMQDATKAADEGIGAGPFDLSGEAHAFSGRAVRDRSADMTGGATSEAANKLGLPIDVRFGNVDFHVETVGNAERMGLGGVKLVGPIAPAKRRLAAKPSVSQAVAVDKV